METECPHCKEKMTIPDSYAVSEVKCEKCKRTFAPKEYKGDTKNNFLYKSAIFIALVVSVLAIIFSIILAKKQKNRTSPVLGNRTSPVRSEPIVPKVSNITFEEINGLYERLDFSDCTTDLQIEEKRKRFERMIKNKYYGKLVQWTGQVADVDRTVFDDKLYVKFKHTERSIISDVTVYFPEREKGRLLKLREGDLVTYQGTIDDISASGLFNHELKNGKIIKHR